MRSVLRSPFVSALIGGVIVAVVFLAVGVGGSSSTRTVVQQAPVSGQSVSNPKSGPTAHQIYEQTAPGVVFIRSQIVQDVQSPFGIPSQQRGEATGSGFVIDKSGRILTNAHVVQGASKVTVQFEGNRSRQAQVVGKDPSSDLALLKVDPSGLKLEPLTLGDSSTAQVGDPVLAIGNPFGLDRTLTTGVVSALQRQIQAPNNFTIDHVIQTDAAINPGNSGGPLLDAAGRVIGINSQIATGGSGSGNVGIGFAIPIDTAKSVLHQLETTGTVKHAWLGISGLAVDPSFGLQARSGVLLESVTPGGPADRAGLRGGNQGAPSGGNGIVLGGDVIQKIDGRSVSSVDDIVSIVESKQPGQTVSVQILRRGSSKTVTVTLGERPKRAPAG